MNNEKTKQDILKEPTASLPEDPAASPTEEGGGAPPEASAADTPDRIESSAQGAADGRVRVATTWLDGCSGCHMSLLDIDERILAVASLIQLVYSPIVDTKEFPDGVDVALIEGAVSSDEDEHKVRLVRERSRMVVSFGDCAVTANVPAMRNQFKVEDVLKCAYGGNGEPSDPPTEGLPKLLRKARPVHEFVSVDLFLPGCPPSSEAIFFVLSELLEGRIPDLTGKSRFGA
jgi:NAD-reducing hydrogenase small subunit